MNKRVSTNSNDVGMLLSLLALYFNYFKLDLRSRATPPPLLLMKTRKRFGPNTLSYGTLDVTAVSSEHSLQ